MADHEGEVIRIALLAGDEGVIQNQSFERCDIKGPAVVLPLESVLEHNRIDGPPDAVLWEIPPPRTHVIGAIALQNCRFTGCHFMNIGFAGSREFIAKLKGQ
jgi:hypothetical protein